MVTGKTQPLREDGCNAVSPGGVVIFFALSLWIASVLDFKSETPLS
jgi:hypothetical protein